MKPWGIADYWVDELDGTIRRRRAGEREDTLGAVKIAGCLLGQAESLAAERDELAATARALRVELGKAESRWSAACRLRNDYRAALERIAEAASILDHVSNDEDDTRDASTMLEDGGTAEDSLVDIRDAAREVLGRVCPECHGSQESQVPDGVPFCSCGDGAK